jgi:hypothetical protein
MDTQLGGARLDGPSAVEGGQCGSWDLIYRVGAAGIDDGGRVRLCFRINSDWGAPQFDSPAAANYVTATTTGPARLTCSYHYRGHVRPWSKALTVLVDDGCLAAGDELRLRLGDRSGGGPGFESQPYAEKRAEFAVFVDAGGTGSYRRVSLDGAVTVHGGPAAGLDLVIPADIVVGEAFRAGIVVRDTWGNTASSRNRVTLSANLPVQGLPEAVEIEDGAIAVTGLVCTNAGVLRLRARLGGHEAASNPAEVHATLPAVRRWWGDLHGQSSETCGTGPVDDYLDYAENVAFIDFAGHQGNDFELTDDAWEVLCSALNAANVEGRFVTFIGYEWSANTAAGGDNNVMFLGDEAPIHRSADWLLPGPVRDPLCWTLDALKGRLAGRDDAMLIPHVGGRYAHPAMVEERYSPLVEIWSTHGEFEWLFEEAVANGQRVGISCGSDDHTGRLGATLPGRNAFAVRGGLLCVAAPELTRPAIWDAIKNARTYGTNGERILVSVSAEGAGPGDDAAAGATVTVAAHGTAPIERIELRRGLAEVVDVHRSAVRLQGGLRVSWRGARNRGRERELRWDGSLVVHGTTFVEAQPYAFDRRVEGIELEDGRVAWRSTTAGDTDGVDLVLSDAEAGTLEIDTPLVSARVELAALGDEPQVHDVLDLLDARLVVERRFEPLGEDVTCSFRLPATVIEPTAFVVVVHQADGGKAWSSPLWVTVQ